MKKIIMIILLATTVIILKEHKEPRRYQYFKNENGTIWKYQDGYRTGFVYENGILIKRREAVPNENRGKVLPSRRGKR